MMEFVRFDHHPNYWGKLQIPWFQTTNQYIYIYIPWSSYVYIPFIGGKHPILYRGSQPPSFCCRISQPPQWVPQLVLVLDCWPHSAPGAPGRVPVETWGNYGKIWGNYGKIGGHCHIPVYHHIMFHRIAVSMKSSHFHSAPCFFWLVSPSFPGITAMESCKIYPLLILHSCWTWP